jgi:Putative zinc-finger
MLSPPVEQATLRPVPLRPAGPVDPAEALAHVRGALPDLSEDAARALSLIEIAGRTRDKAVEEMEISAEALAELLYEARKALRRSLFPLSASGWCERAERLLSDRIDGALVPPGPARLDVHLRNCERCVDHERRLSQAREKLVREFVDAHPHTAGAGPAERPVAALRVVEPVVVARVYEGPTRVVPAFSGVVSQPDEGAPLPHSSFAGPGGQVEIRVELGPVAVEREELPEDPPLDADVPPAEPADATPSEHDAEEPEPPVEETETAVGPATLVWGGLTVVSVGLAVFALVITVLAVYGLAGLF